MNITNINILRTALGVLFFGVISSFPVLGQNIEGSWMLELNGSKQEIDNSITIGAPSDNEAAIIGELILRKEEKGWQAHVEVGLLR